MAPALLELNNGPLPCLVESGLERAEKTQQNIITPAPMRRSLESKLAQAFPGTSENVSDRSLSPELSQFLLSSTCHRAGVVSLLNLVPQAVGNKCLHL